MPRGGDVRQRNGDGERERPERPDRRGPRQSRGGSDEEALRLRDEGRSFAAVARTLNMKRANDARASFLRALRSRPEDEQAKLIERERARLDQLEVRIRDRDKDDQVRLDRRLAALETMRSAIA
jgi:hypothetical protein